MEPAAIAEPGGALAAQKLVWKGF